MNTPMSDPALRPRTPPMWSTVVWRTIFWLCLCALEVKVFLIGHDSWFLRAPGIAFFVAFAGYTVRSFVQTYRKRRRGEWPPPPDPNAHPRRWPDEAAAPNYLRRRRERRQEQQASKTNG